MDTEEGRKVINKLQYSHVSDIDRVEALNTSLQLCGEVERLREVAKVSKEMVIIWKEPNFYQLYLKMDRIRDALARLEGE